MNVYHDRKLVGSITQNSSMRMEFIYSRAWTSSPESFAISESLPLDGSWKKEADHNYFSNLLPEGNAREQIARRLGISIENDYAFLQALGRDCAGALTIGEPYPPQKYDEFDVITDENLKALLQNRLSLPEQSDGTPVRFSLAGAMNKWAVYVSGDSIAWPLGDTPSTHILKLDPYDYKHISYNEAFTSELGRIAGLDAVKVFPYPSYSLIHRYDRGSTAEGLSYRIHQEDMMQALGEPGSRKYQSEGGPSLKEVAALIRRVSTSPSEDIEHLIRWQIFNALSGNCDGHAKNLSLIKGGNTTRLAPVYDILCTRIHPGTSKELAFSLGGTFEPGQIRSSNVRAFADDLNVSVKLINQEMKNMLSVLKENTVKRATEFQDTHGKVQMVDEIARGVMKRIRRLENNFVGSS